MKYLALAVVAAFLILEAAILLGLWVP